MKYGAWFLHRVPLAGHLRKADLMKASKNPIVYTKVETEFRAIRSVIERDFVWRENFAEPAQWRFVFKTSAVHEAEFELIEKMIAGKWAEIPGIVLSDRRMPN